MNTQQQNSQEEKLITPGLNDMSAAIKLAVMQENILFIKGSISSLIEKFDKLDDKYVSKNEFGLVRAIVYGLVTIVLVTVFAAVLAPIIKK